MISPPVTIYLGLDLHAEVMDAILAAIQKWRPVGHAPSPDI
jgi:hypothetical protein